MAYEIKALLMPIAKYAAKIKNKEMYEYLADLANVEGVIVKAYDEAEEKALTRKRKIKTKKVNSLF